MAKKSTFKKSLRPAPAPESTGTRGGNVAPPPAAGKQTHVAESYPTRWLPVNELGIVWPEAQREVIHESTIVKITTPFDPDALGLLCVAEKNGFHSYHIIDGRHRHMALQRMGYNDQLVLCEVANVTNAEEAARLFRRRNARQSVSALDSFKTGVRAGFELEVAINQIVTACGYHIGLSANPRMIASIGSIKEIYRKFGGEALTHTLQLISATWSDDQTAVNGVMLRAVGAVIGVYGDRIDYKRFREKLGKKAPGNLIAAIRSQKEILGGNATTAGFYVIVNQYNAGMRKAGDILSPHLFAAAAEGGEDEEETTNGRRRTGKRV